MNNEVVSETELLGTYLNGDLKWDHIFHKFLPGVRGQTVRLASSRKGRDEKQVNLNNMQFVRHVLQQSATVWHSSTTTENSKESKMFFRGQGVKKSERRKNNKYVVQILIANTWEMYIQSVIKITSTKTIYPRCMGCELAL